MAGGIDKARSLMRVRPDRRGLRILGRALVKGDDALLRGLAAELEGEGIEIVPCTTFLDRLLFPAGVLVVCVLDPETESVGVYTENEFPRRLTIDEDLTLPEVFPDFRVPVRQFFE